MTNLPAADHYLYRACKRWLEIERTSLPNKNIYIYISHYIRNRQPGPRLVKKPHSVACESLLATTSRDCGEQRRITITTICVLAGSFTPTAAECGARGRGLAGRTRCAERRRDGEVPLSSTAAETAKSQCYFKSSCYY